MPQSIAFLSTNTLISIALGLILILWGYRLKKIAFAIAWFAVGYYFISLHAEALIANLLPNIENPTLWVNLLPIIAGILLSFMGFTIERLCVSALTYLAILTFALQQFGTTPQIFLIATVIGVIAACFAVALMKPAIVVLTAFIGAECLVRVILPLLPLDYIQYYAISLLIITVVGAIIQFRLCRYVD